MRFAIAGGLGVGLGGEGQGRLVALSPETGEALFDVGMAGRGMRYTVPLVVGDRIYVSSCPGDRAPGFVEGFELRRR